MGPESLRELLQLPLQAIEFAAFGGTNFAKVELLRDERASQALYEPLSTIGEDVYSMLDYVNMIVAEQSPVCKELIISGRSKKFPGRLLPGKKIYSSGNLRYGLHLS